MRFFKKQGFNLGGLSLVLALSLSPGCSDNLRIKTFGSSSCSQELGGTCPTIERVSPLASTAGSLVTIHGKNFAPKTAFLLDSLSLETTRVDEKTVTFVMPQGNTGYADLSIIQKSKDLTLEGSSQKIFRLQGGEQIVSTVDAKDFCEGLSFLDVNGQEQEGTRICELADPGLLKPEFIRSGITIGSVQGIFLPTITEKYKNCQSDGEINCLSNASFRAALATGLSAKLLSGQTAAGVVGTVSPETHSNCTGANQTGCVATSTYKTIDLSAASASATDLSAANFNAALASSSQFEFWDSSGARHQFSGDSNLLASNILNGTSLFGVSGSLSAAPANCSADGAASCVVVGPTYAAADTTGLADKVLSTSSLAGVNGNVLLPAVAKVLSGASFGPSTSPLTGELSLPLASQVLTGSGAYGDSSAQLIPSYAPDFPSLANVREQDTVNGAGGTLLDCSAGNQSGCATTPTYKSMNLSAAGTDSGLTNANFNATIRTAANFEFWDASGERHSVAGDSNIVAGNLKNTIVIFGVTGNLAGAPANCSSDGEDSCLVDGSSFAAAEQTGAADKILSGQTLGGVAGNVTLPAAAKVLSGIQYGVAGTGSTGTLTLPAASNVLTSSGTYGDPGSAVTPSYSPDFPLAANVHSSDTVDGFTGTLLDCSAGNQSGCLAVADYRSINLSAASAATDLTAANFNATIATAANFEFWDSSGARHQVAGDSDLSAANVLTGSNIFGVAGSATPAPANCSSSGSQSCIATASYYAATACSANGSACFVPTYQLTTQPLKAIDHDAIDAGKASVLSSLTLSGIQGTIPNCSAANSVGCLTTADYKSINLSAAGTDTGLTAANLTTRIATAASSEFWDASGTRHSVSGDADLSAGNIKNGVVIHGATGTYPSSTNRLAADTATTDLTSFASQLKTNGGFEFFDSTGTRYTGSGDSDLVPANVKNALAIESLSLTGNYVATLSCPTGWIKVPGDIAYGTGDFCVMKYEAKDVSGVATSQAALVPWYVTQLAAITSCRALGTGYDLISNPEWMTLSSNVAGINGNWTGNTVGSGSIFSGHTDNSPAAGCGASTNDSLFYVESNCTPVSTGDTTEQRRTFTLSNGEVVWDISGNYWDWVNYINTADKPNAGGAWTEYTAVTGTTTTSLKDLIPTAAVKAFWSNSWNSTQIIGQYYPGSNGSGGAMMRGQTWSFGASSAGIFTVGFHAAPSTLSHDIGFRCRGTPSL